MAIRTEDNSGQKNGTIENNNLNNVAPSPNDESENNDEILTGADNLDILTEYNNARYGDSFLSQHARDIEEAKRNILKLRENSISEIPTFSDTKSGIRNPLFLPNSPYAALALQKYGYNNALGLSEQINRKGETIDLINQGLGESKYDREAFSIDELYNLEAHRGNVQSGFMKLASGVPRFGVKTATTVAHAAGFFWGLAEVIGGKALNDDVPTWSESPAGRLNRIFDNAVDNKIDEIDKYLLSYFPAYRTKKVQESAWYENLGDPTIWAEFIEQAGFTAGMVFSGLGFNAALRGLHLLKSGVVAARLGSAFSALNEAGTEARTTVHGMKAEEYLKLEDQFSRAREAYDNEFKQKYGEAALRDAKENSERYLDEVNKSLNELERRRLNQQSTIAENPSLSQFNKSLSDAQYESDKQNILNSIPKHILEYMSAQTRFANKYNELKKDIDNRADKAGLRSMIENSLWLYGSNMFQFEMLYKQGFVNEAARELARHTTGSMGAYSWRRLSHWGSIGSGLSKGLSEGIEEMVQQQIDYSTRGAQSYVDADAYYKILTDDKYVAQMRGVFNAAFNAFKDTWGDVNNYHQFASGALMGILGTGTFGRSQNSGINTFIGRGKRFGWSGGLFGEFVRTNYLNKIGEQNVETMNQLGLNAEQLNNDGTIPSMSDDEKTKTIISNMAVAFAGVDDNNKDKLNVALDQSSRMSQFAMMVAFARQGRLSDLEEILSNDVANASDEELQRITALFYDKNDPAMKNEDGSLLVDSEEGRNKMRTILSNRQNELKNQLNKFKDAVKESIGMVQESFDVTEEMRADMVWKYWNRLLLNEDVKNQSKQFIDSSGKNIENINKLHADALKIQADLLKKLKDLQNAAAGSVGSSTLNRSVNNGNAGATLTNNNESGSTIENDEIKKLRQQLQIVNDALLSLNYLKEVYNEIDKFNKSDAPNVSRLVSMGRSIDGRFGSGMSSSLVDTALSKLAQADLISQTDARNELDKILNLLDKANAEYAFTESLAEATKNPAKYYAKVSARADEERAADAANERQQAENEERRNNADRDRGRYQNGEDLSTQELINLEDHETDDDIKKRIKLERKVSEIIDRLLSIIENQKDISEDKENGIDKNALRWILNEFVRGVRSGAISKADDALNAKKYQRFIDSYLTTHFGDSIRQGEDAYDDAAASLLTQIRSVIDLYKDKYNKRIIRREPKREVPKRRVVRKRTTKKETTTTDTTEVVTEETNNTNDVTEETITTNVVESTETIRENIFGEGNISIQNPSERREYSNPTSLDVVPEPNGDIDVIANIDNNDKEQADKDFYFFMSLFARENQSGHPISVDDNGKPYPSTNEKSFFGKRVVYNYLKSKEAFERNAHNVNIGDEIFFAIDPKLNEQAGEFIILIVNKDGQVINALPFGVVNVNGKYATQYATRGKIYRNFLRYAVRSYVAAVNNKQISGNGLFIIPNVKSTISDKSVGNPVFLEGEKEYIFANENQNFIFFNSKESNQFIYTSSYGENSRESVSNDDISVFTQNGLKALSSLSDEEKQQLNGKPFVLVSNPHDDSTGQKRNYLMINVTTDYAELNNVDESKIKNEKGVVSVESSAKSNKNDGIGNVVYQYLRIVFYNAFNNRGNDEFYLEKALRKHVYNAYIICRYAEDGKITVPEDGYKLFGEDVKIKLVVEGDKTKARIELSKKIRSSNSMTSKREEKTIDNLIKVLEKFKVLPNINEDFLAFANGLRTNEKVFKANVATNNNGEVELDVYRTGVSYENGRDVIATNIQHNENNSTETNVEGGNEYLVTKLKSILNQMTSDQVFDEETLNLLSQYIEKYPNEINNVISFFTQSKERFDKFVNEIISYSEPIGTNEDAIYLSYLLELLKEQIELEENGTQDDQNVDEVSEEGSGESGDRNDVDNTENKPSKTCPILSEKRFNQIVSKDLTFTFTYFTYKNVIDALIKNKFKEFGEFEQSLSDEEIIKFSNYVSDNNVRVEDVELGTLNYDRIVAEIKDENDVSNSGALLRSEKVTNQTKDEEVNSRKVKNALSHDREQLDKEIENIHNILPQLSEEERTRVVEGVDDLSKDPDVKVYGYYKNGIIYIAEHGERGTAYHEAFHFTTQSLLTAEERVKLYNAAKKRFGNLSNLELEEKLAEAFREYYELDVDPNVSIIRRFFRRIKNVIKAIGGKYFDRLYIDNMFYNLARGNFAKRQVISNVSNSFVSAERLNSKDKENSFDLITRDDINNYHESKLAYKNLSSSVKDYFKKNNLYTKEEWDKLPYIIKDNIAYCIMSVGR